MDFETTLKMLHTVLDYLEETEAHDGRHDRLLDNAWRAASDLYDFLEELKKDTV